MSTSAIVIAKVTVEVHVGNWNHKASFESLREQVMREAKQKLQTHLSAHGDYVVKDVTAVTVVLNADIKEGAQP